MCSLITIIIAEKPSQDVHSSDQEEPDAEALEEDETVHDISAEEEPEDMTPTSFFRNTLQKIYTHWSDHFITDSIDIVHGFRNRYQTGRDLKLYILDLEDLKHSWLVDLVM